MEPGDVVQGVLGDCYLLAALTLLATRESEPNINTLFPMRKLKNTESAADGGGGAQTHSHGKRPSVRYEVQQYNTTGLYAVRLYEYGDPVVVVVDDYVPVDMYGRLAFSKSRGGEGREELWVVLVEKAVAKLFGSYEAIISGNVFEALQVREVTATIVWGCMLVTIPSLHPPSA